MNKVKYFTKQYCEKSLKIIESDIFTINDKAKRKDELFYQEVYNETYNHYCTVWNYKLTELEFNNLLDDKTNFYKELLPDHIKCKIADIRVMAMGVVSQEIYNDICEYNNQLLIYCEEARTRYKKDYSETIKYLSNSCKKALDCNLSDAKILKYEILKDQLRLYFSLDTYTQNNDYDLLYLFNEGTFIEKIGILEQDYLRTYEIYATEKDIEFHILCENSQCIIQAKDLNYKYSESFKFRDGIE